MDKIVRIGIIGDYDGRASHLATNKALHHCAKKMGLQLEIRWLPTTLLEGEGAECIQSCDGVWCAPGSPYKSMRGALDAIRQARENDIPFIGTCGGFQHAVIEFAQNVLGIQNAAHAEIDPASTNLFITALACSLAGQSHPIRIRRGTLSYQCYGCSSSTESFLCSFGLNPSHQKLLEVHGMQTAAEDENGEARILELAGNRYFIATLFVPQLTSTEESPHPLVLAFLSAAAGRDSAMT